MYTVSPDAPNEDKFQQRLLDPVLELHIVKHLHFTVDILLYSFPQLYDINTSKFDNCHFSFHSPTFPIIFRII